MTMYTVNQSWIMYIITFCRWVMVENIPGLYTFDEQ